MTFVTLPRSYLAPNIGHSVRVFSGPRPTFRSSIGHSGGRNPEMAILGQQGKV
jgi:hypothetical protein